LPTKVSVTDCKTRCLTDLFSLITLWHCPA